MNRNFTSLHPVASPLRTGMGDLLSPALSTAAGTLSTIASTGAMTTSTGAAGAGAAAAGAASLATMGITAGLAIAGIGIQAWIASARLRGQQKIGATNIANQVEYKLKELQSAYNASAKTFEDWQYAKQQQQALYDYLMSPNGCGNAQLGSAGQRCISERIGSGAKYPWEEWYDLGPAPTTHAQASGGGAGASVLDSPIAIPGLGGIPMILLLGIGLIAIAFLMPSEPKGSSRGRY